MKKLLSLLTGTLSLAMMVGVATSHSNVVAHAETDLSETTDRARAEYDYGYVPKTTTTDSSLATNATNVTENTYDYSTEAVSITLDNTEIIGYFKLFDEPAQVSDLLNSYFEVYLRLEEPQVSVNLTLYDGTGAKTSSSYPVGSLIEVGDSWYYACISLSDALSAATSEEFYSVRFRLKAKTTSTVIVDEMRIVEKSTYVKKDVTSKYELLDRAHVEHLLWGSNAGVQETEIVYGQSSEAVKFSTITAYLTRYFALFDKAVTADQLPDNLKVSFYIYLDNISSFTINIQLALTTDTSVTPSTTKFEVSNSNGSLVNTSVENWYYCEFAINKLSAAATTEFNGIKFIFKEAQEGFAVIDSLMTQCGDESVPYSHLVMGLKDASTCEDYVKYTDFEAIYDLLTAEEKETFASESVEENGGTVLLIDKLNYMNVLYLNSLESTPVTQDSLPNNNTSLLPWIGLVVAVLGLSISLYVFKEKKVINN